MKGVSRCLIEALNSLSYKIDISQLAQLLEAAELLEAQAVNVKPVYVFYNSLIPKSPLIADPQPAQLGCIFVDANTLFGYLDDEEKTSQATALLPFQIVMQKLNPQP